MTISSGVPPRTRFIRPAHSSSDDLPRPSLDIAVIGLSITSSWGNGHATNYRALVRALAARIAFTADRWRIVAIQIG